MKILIVDDSRAMRLLIARALRKAGLAAATYLEAGDGEEALKTIQEARPELVISDFNMPRTSGIELLKAVRAGGFDTRFGLVTSEASPELHEEAIQAGARFIITKPFTPATLVETLTPVLAELGCRALNVDDDGPQEYAGGTSQFPNAVQVGSILRELLRRAAGASPAGAMALPPPPGHVIAEYRRNDDGSLLACGICDIPWAVRAGAALTMIPPAAAEDAITHRRVADTVAENLHEVLNVMSRLFNGGNSRVSLGPVHLPGQILPADLAARIARPGSRLDLKVDIEGYGNGNLTLLSFS